MDAVEFDDDGGELIAAAVRQAPVNDGSRRKRPSSDAFDSPEKRARHEHGGSKT